MTLDFEHQPLSDAEVLATETTKHHTLEEWEIEGSAGDRVRVDFFFGDIVDRVVLAAHGADNSRKARYIEVMSKTFPRHGTAIVAMDAPFHGDRVDAHEMVDPVGANVDLLIRSVKDHRRVLDVVADRWSGVPVGLAGFSMGGLHGVPLMAIDERVRSAAIVIAGSTRVSYPQRFRRLSKPVRERIAVTDPAVHAPRIGPRPVMLLNASEDEIVPRDSAIALYDALPGPKELVFMPGTHTEWGHAARWFRRLEQFFTETLNR